MGGSSSSLCELHTNDYLQRLSGSEPISANDPFWNQLLSFTFIPPNSCADAKLLEEQTASILSGFAVNNARTGNLASFVMVFERRVEQILQMDFSEANDTAKERDIFCMQTYNALFILRSIVKHLVENVSEEVLLHQFCLPNPALSRHSSVGGGDAADGAVGIVETEEEKEQCLLETFLVNLVTLLVDLPVTPDTYGLHLESVNSLLVLLSVQMYRGLCTEGLTAFRLLMTGKCSLHACLLTKRLLLHFKERRVTPAMLLDPNAVSTGSAINASSSLLYSMTTAVASTLWSVMTLGYGGRGGHAAPQLPTLLSDQSLLLLLILVNHCANSRDSSNPYRQSLFHFTDAENWYRPDGADSSSGSTSDSDSSTSSSKGPKALGCLTFTMDVSSLFSALCQRLHEDPGTVLFYLLMHRNPTFRKFVITHEDCESVLMPIMRTLYKSPSDNSHHIYMSLIVVLMLTEDERFNRNIHDVKLHGITWTTEHSFSEITLGSLLVYTLIRTIQHNLQHLRDKYLHTNCLAALANMSSRMHELDAYVSQRLINLVCHLAKRHVRTVEKIRLAASQPSCEADGGLGSTEHEYLQDLSVLEEVIRYMLEIVNSVISHCLVSNPHLLYNLLHRRSNLEPFRTHPSFQDVMQNIDMVLGFFLNKLNSTDASKDPSASRVMSIIQGHVRALRKENLKKFPELKFKYVEEDSPEEFFVPYMWSLVYQRSNLYFNAAKVALFRLQPAPDAAIVDGGSQHGAQPDSVATHSMV